MKIKKLIAISIFALLSLNISSEPYIGGKMQINDINTLSNTTDSYNIANWASFNLMLDMNVTSNGVKFYSKGLFSGTGSTSSISSELTKAYVKYRIPYRDNYINFQVGKSYYSLGGGLIYNAGNPIFENNLSFDETKTYVIQTNWNAVATLPLEKNENYSLYLGIISLLPIEDTKIGAGGFLDFEIGNKYFDNFEISLFAREDENLLTLGYKGTLYFDYGIFANINLYDTKDFNISLFATKIYDKLTFNIESLYENQNETTNKALLMTPSISYQVDDKLCLTITNSMTAIYNNELSIENLFVGSLSYSIVQGFTFGSSLGTKFNKDYLAILGFSMEFKF